MPVTLSEAQRSKTAFQIITYRGLKQLSHYHILSKRTVTLSHAQRSKTTVTLSHAQRSKTTVTFLQAQRHKTTVTSQSQRPEAAVKFSGTILKQLSHYHGHRGLKQLSDFQVQWYRDL